MKQIKWDANKADWAQIEAITGRAARVLKLDRDARHNLRMSIAACHLNGCPLRLQELATADDFNFAHDVVGIDQHIDHETGKLQYHFRPRFAA